jgi:hypothetical protein
MSRSLRTRIWMARGLLAEAAGSPETGADWFARAAGGAARICALRKDDPSRYALSLQRHGETLACLRQPGAVTVLDDALDIRERKLAQGHAFWAVRDCAKSLWWAYQRLSRGSEADAVARRYHFTSGSGDWMPAFVPDIAESITREHTWVPSAGAAGAATVGPECTAVRDVGVVRECPGS